MNELATRLREFKEQGYTLFENVYGLEQIRKWIQVYHDLVRRCTPPDAEEPAFWHNSVMEQEPWAMLPFVSNPTILDFAERVIGPFVQLDNLTLATFPSVTKQEANGEVSFWHRDRWAVVADGTDYVRPWGFNAICYLQDMTEEYGPLRVVPGSHRRHVTVPQEAIKKPHPQEKVLHMKAGDVAFTHNSLLHSGTPNTSGKPRYFLSAFYTRSGLRTFDNHSGPNVRKIVEMARKREDRRLMRLFSVDDLLEARANSAFTVADEEMWDRWIKEDRAALKA